MNKHIKVKVHSELKANKNITMMVMGSSALYLFGNTPFLVINSLHFGKGFSMNSTVQLLEKITRFIIHFSRGSNFFVYFFFNKIFREIFFSYFKIRN